MSDTQTAPPRPLIRVRDLSKVYAVGEEKVIALRHINLTIPEGEICCILGTSGSGKSTLLNQLAGMEKPSAGDVFIGNAALSRMGEGRLADFRQSYLGFIFQSYNLLPQLSAVENVALPLAFRGIPKATRERLAIQMLVRVGLKHRLHHYPRQMSGGQQQRVGIARAFINKPKVVFADEPTGNLDSRTTEEVLGMMREFVRSYRQTLILVTHDPTISTYADRVITLKDGIVISNITKGEQNNETSA